MTRWWISFVVKTVRRFTASVEIAIITIWSVALAAVPLKLRVRQWRSGPKQSPRSMAFEKLAIP
jgi:hypothetical protein